MVYKQVKTIEDAEYCQLVEKGDSVEGILVNKVPSEKYGHIYKIEVEGEELPRFLLGTVHLEKLMHEVEIGDKVRIVLSDFKDTGKGNKMKFFDVFVDDGNVETEKVE